MIATIRRLLETQLATLSPAWAMAWEGKAFTPIPGTPHLRVYLLPAAVQTLTMFSDGPSIQTGIFQVSVATPDEGGSAVGDARVDAIVALFPRGLGLVGGSPATRLWIPERASVAPAIYEPAFRVVPVSIPWSAFV